MAKKKPVLIPAELIALSERVNITTDLEKGLKALGFDGIANSYCKTHIAHGNLLDHSSVRAGSILDVPHFYIEENAGLPRYSVTWPVQYYLKDGSMWTTNLAIVFDGYAALSPSRFGYSPRHLTDCSYRFVNARVQLSAEWSCVTKLACPSMRIQSETEIYDILDDINPYAARYCRSINGDPAVLLVAPWIEILCKAGYQFAKDVCVSPKRGKSYYDVLTRLCQPGKNPAEIFKCHKAVYSVLKEERDLAIWDVFRRMSNMGRISTANVRDVYESGFGDQELKRIGNILAFQHEGASVFTWNSLMNYLHRVDKYEAVPASLALELIDDYLRCCKTLHMKPNMESDSIKREHDVASRLASLSKNGNLENAMCDACHNLGLYDYKEPIFFVRGIRSQKDLLDEAVQQHNCLAAYARDIANEKSMIYVVRQVANPDKSFVTIEIDAAGNVTQKRQSCDRPVRSQAVTDFLARWKQHIQKVNSGASEPQVFMEDLYWDAPKPLTAVVV